ncbi:hypothetical protein [Paenibacillus guangzhouensis]|uniref:hypothetical protein n=1 Tax=Paenibacillus guangzhouensis TaxID=1473112 RepID=UPI00126768D0|nr:hypothetical protein [Paenibacillus guangzhouensis]
MFGLLQQSMTLKRLHVTLDALNSPSVEQWVLIGRFRSRWRRKQFQPIGPETNSVKIQVRERYRVYVPIWCGVRAGDLVYRGQDPEPFGVSAAYPYGRQHMEVEVERVRSL